MIPSEESIEARIELFLDLFVPVLDVGLAHPHVGLYSHGLESLVFAEVKRTLVRVPDSRNADGGFFGFDVRDGIEEPVAYFTNRIPYGRWSEQRPNNIEAVVEAVAFVVCHAIGLDTNSDSSDYIQLYNGDKETLLQSLERIQRTAAGILGAVMDKDSGCETAGGESCVVVAA